jgi:polysaccharide chain length determinant protein (PEP-CTERM system associated)
MFFEDKLKNLRERVKINVSRARSQNDAFSISFRGSDPVITMKITNALASYFIDENLKLRESHASGTNVFLQDELSSTRDRLQRIEETLQKYRKQYMGELPEQLQTNLSILSRAQEQLIEKQKSLRETKAMLVSLERQMAEMPDIQLNDSLWTTEDNFELEDDNSSKIAQLKEELATLKLKYTDRHPDVIGLKDTIARLEEQAEKEAEDGSETAASDPSESELAAELPEIGFDNLQKVQQDEMRRDINQQKAEIAELTETIRLYQQRVENTPKREQELFSLKRDYDNIKSSYDSLVERKLEAEIAVNMEKKQKGEQFRIIDHAVLPQKPVSPDMRKLFVFSVAAGLGIGAGLIFLLDFMNSTLKQPKDYETELGLVVLATIPKLPSPKDKILHRINGGLTAVSLFFAAALTAGFGLLIVKGVEPIIELVSKYVRI